MGWLIWKSVQFCFIFSRNQSNHCSFCCLSSLVVNLEMPISQAFHYHLKFCGSHFTFVLIPITIFNQFCILNSFPNNYLFGISGIDRCMNCPIAFGLPVFPPSLSLNCPVMLINVSCVLVLYLSLQMFLVFLCFYLSSKAQKARAPHPPTESVRGTLSLCCCCCCCWGLSAHGFYPPLEVVHWPKIHPSQH